MSPQGCDLAAPGDKLYSSATRKTYQSKIAQIQTIKIFRRSNIPLSLLSFLVVSFYALCSLEARDWCEFFTVRRTGITRNLQAVRYIFRFYLCDEINQGKRETRVSLFTSICYERKHVSDLSMLVFCFHSQTFVVYLQTTKVHSSQRFQGTHSTFSTPEIPPVKSPHAFGFPIVNTPHALRIP